MATLSYNARERRLVLDSLCWPEDAPSIADAIAAFAEPASALVVDLTRMPYVPAEVADAIETACTAAEADGCRVRVWTAATPVGA